MPEFKLNTWRGDIVMSLPASMPLFAAAEATSVEGLAEVAEVQGIASEPGCGLSPGIGTALAIGVAALLTGSAHLFLRARRVQFALNLAGSMVQSSLKALADDDNLQETRASLGRLERDAPGQLGSQLSDLFACISHVFASDHRAGGDLGQVGPSYLLYRYYVESGDPGRSRAAARAVYHTYLNTPSSFSRAAEIHSRLSSGVSKLVNIGDWEGLFVKAMHAMAAAQLLFRRAVGGRGFDEQVSGLKSAHVMINRTLSSTQSIMSGWVSEQAVQRSGNETGPRDEITEVVEVGQQFKGFALDRVGLLLRPAEALEYDVRMALNQLRERDWFDRGGPGERGDVTYFRGPMPLVKRGGSGPDPSAMSALSPGRCPLFSGAGTLFAARPVLLMP